jgi:hypothetical protein
MLKQQTQERVRKQRDGREKPLFFAPSEAPGDGAVNPFSDQDVKPRWWPGEIPVPLPSAKK